MKCKVIRTKSANKSLEDDINNFFNANPNISIKHITQSYAANQVVYTSVFYED